MPTYKITDPQTGKMIKVTGDSPPSEQELNQIFSATSSSGSTQKPGIDLGGVVSGINNLKKGVNDTVNNVVGAAGDLLLPKTTAAIRGVGTNGLQSLNAESSAPMSGVDKAVGFGLSVLPGGSSLGQQNTPLGAAARELGSNVVAGELINSGMQKAGELAKPIIEKGRDILGKGVGYLAEKTGVSGLANNVSRAAVNKLTAISQPEYEKFALSAGRDLPEVAGEWMKKSGGNLNKLVGSAKNRFSEGMLHTEKKVAEDAIQQTVKNSGNAVIAATDDIVGGLAKNVDDLSGIAGNEDKVAAITKFIEDTKKLYPNGFTAKDLLRYKRAADAKFGEQALTTTMGDSALQQAQVDTGNAARNILKRIFPDIAENLQKEQEIIHLIPILRQQIGRDAVSKTALPEAFSKLHVTRPGTLVQTIMDIPAVTRFSASGSLPIPGAKTATGVANTTLNSPIFQRGILSPGIVNATQSQPGGGGRLGLNIPPKYSYK